MRTFAVCLIAAGCAAAAASAADAPKSKPAAKPRPAPRLPEGTRIEPLWADRAPGAIGDTPADTPSIGIFPAPADKAVGTGVVVVPGGGYGHLALDHEGVQVARWLNGLGVSAFVLQYRIAPRYKHPAPITDAQRAIRTVRARAREFGLDPARVGILGFSAGGHLTSTAATHFDDGKPDAVDPVERVSCRPDFVILGYPVITMEPPTTHGGSRRNLLGDKPDADLVAGLCNERQVTAKTPPSFVFHSRDDKVVILANTELWKAACDKAGVPCEVAIYEQGGHGCGMCGRPDQQKLDCAAWPARAAAWMKSRGLLDKK